MDPNRFVNRMLNQMQIATSRAKEGDYAGARAAWTEVSDNLEDLSEWLNKGGFPPNQTFYVQI